MKNKFNLPQDLPGRLQIYCMLYLSVQIFSLLALFFRGYILHEYAYSNIGEDFQLFVSAARVMREHGAESIYSRQFMSGMEVALGRHSYVPWVSPPQLLLLITPFSFLPIAYGLMVFMAVGVASYARGIGKILEPLKVKGWVYALAFPGIISVFIEGQLSFLVTGLAIFALLAIPRSPLLAGVIISLLTIKPQFGVLIPIILLCRCSWKVFAFSSIFSIFFSVLCAALFGPHIYITFFHSIVQFNHQWVEGLPALRPYLLSAYGVLRNFGVGEVAAYSIQAVIAIFALFVLVWLWRGRARYSLCAAAFFPATLLTQAYVPYYEMLWLAPAAAFLARDMTFHGANRVEIGLLVLAFFAPIETVCAAHMGNWTHLDILGCLVFQWAPLISLALLAVALRRHLTIPPRQDSLDPQSL